MKSICFVFIILISSCSATKYVEHLNLYNGVSQITPVNSETIGFLANLKDYNNLMTLCYVNFQGELVKVHPIDKYSNVDVNSDFIKVFNHNNRINTVYERKGRELIIEEYNKYTVDTRYRFLRSKSSYGSLFQIGSEGYSAYIKSSNFYSSRSHRGYNYNYFILDDDFETIKSGIISLGNFYPQGMTIMDGKIFYYTDDRQLFYKSVYSRKTFPVYSFDSDIIDIKSMDNRIFVLLENFLYLANSDGEVTKGFNLNLDEFDYRASSIINSGNNTIIVEIKSDKDTLYKTFSIFGNQISEKSIDVSTVGDAYFFTIDGRYSILYSDKNSLYLKKF